MNETLVQSRTLDLSFLTLLVDVSLKGGMKSQQFEGLYHEEIYVLSYGASSIFKCSVGLGLKFYKNLFCKVDYTFIKIVSCTSAAVLRIVS